MIARLIARWRRYWHCLAHLHRALTVEYPGGVVLGCECGRMFYGAPAEDAEA